MEGSSIMPFEKRLARGQVNYVNREIIKKEYTNQLLIGEGRSVTYDEIQGVIKSHNIKSSNISIECGSYTFTLHRVSEPSSTTHSATYMGVNFGVGVNGKIESLIVVNPLSELEVVDYPYSISLVNGEISDISANSPNIGGNGVLLRW